MNRRILLSSLLTLPLVILCACNGIDKLPGTTGGALSVQFTQAPPAPTIAGQPVALVANVLNDSKNGGVTWSCTPANACGTFTPTTTAYNVGTQYMPPVAPPNGPITSNLAYPVTITATSVSDTSQSVSQTINIAQQYAFVMAGYASFGMVGSVTLDGNGNVVAGETDYSANPGQEGNFPITGTYTLDATTGFGTMTWSIQGCCSQNNAITATSNSHLTVAEIDQFSGLTFGALGSMDLQTAAFSASSISGGYSFTLSGYDHAMSFNGSWGGIFTADGVGAITGGIFDTSLGGGASGYSSAAFTGAFTTPDSHGRGFLDLSNGSSYVYYLVTPEVLRLTTVNDSVNKLTLQTAANTGSAYGQGSLATGATEGALTGNFIFSDFGFTSDANGGVSGAAAGLFNSSGAGTINSGTMDVNSAGTVSSVSLSGSTYSISGSPRGTLTASDGQTYNVYLTDPNLNLLDPNNTTGGGGGLLLEADAGDAIGLIIPQTDTGATLTGNYAFGLADQANPPNSDGGFDGQFAVSTSSDTFSGQGGYQGTASNGLIPIIGPLAGTFAADPSNLGRFTGTISTTPALWSSSIGGTTAGNDSVSYYLANESQGFVVETDSVAPGVGMIEGQGTLQSGSQSRNHNLQQGRSSRLSNQPVGGTTQHPATSRRSR